MMTARRSIWIVLGSLGLMAVGFALHADPKAPPAPAADSQIKAAVLNLSYVIKNYKKWKEFQEEYKKKLEDLDERVKKRQANADELTKEESQIPDKVANAKRIVKDKIDEGKKVLADLEAKQFLEIYKDVTVAAERHAKAHGIEIVMHYNDGTTEDELYDPMNIGRKMPQGALFPLYLAPGVDISKEALAALNGE